MMNGSDFLLKPDSMDQYFDEHLAFIESAFQSNANHMPLYLYLAYFLCRRTTRENCKPGGQQVDIRLYYV